MAVIAAVTWQVQPLIAIDDAFLLEAAAWEGARSDVFNPDGMERAQWPTIGQVMQALPGYAFDCDGLRLYCTPIRPPGE